MKRLEDHYADEVHAPSAYDLPVFIDWYLEGNRDLAVEKKNLKPLLWFAAANGILDLDTSTDAWYVFGMRVQDV